MPNFNTQAVGKHGLGFYPVFDSDKRKVGAINLRFTLIAYTVWIDGGRACRAKATADIIDANHKKLIGIDGFIRANHIVPPARFFIVITMEACRMMAT